MIPARALLGALGESGFGLITGVPCSYLTPLINAVIDSPITRYVNATNEGDAVAIACGAELGGTPSVVMFQNSGFGNAVSPLTSLAAVFDLPVLVFATWRSQPGGPADEPQHQLMGPITPGLFDLMEIPWELFPSDVASVADMLRRALAHMRDTGRPYGIILPKGSIEGVSLETQPDRERRHELASAPPPTASHPRLDPDDVLRAVQRHAVPPAVVIATTGHTGRALYALDDRPNQLYMVGSMGCVSSLALGLALAQPQRRIIVLDGDGACLMRLGALATIADEAPPNLVHLLLDNAVHESTGGQSTVATGVDFASAAAACGYPRVARITSLDELDGFLGPDPGTLSFGHIRTDRRRGTSLPRPNMTPREVANRLRVFMETHT